MYLHSVHLILSHRGWPHGVWLRRTAWLGRGCSMYMCRLTSLGMQTGPSKMPDGNAGRHNQAQDVQQARHTEALNATMIASYTLCCRHTDSLRHALHVSDSTFTCFLSAMELMHGRKQ